MANKQKVNYLTENQWVCLRYEFANIFHLIWWNTHTKKKTPEQYFNKLEIINSEVAEIKYLGFFYKISSNKLPCSGFW